MTFPFFSVVKVGTEWQSRHISSSAKRDNGGKKRNKIETIKIFFLFILVFALGSNLCSLRVAKYKDFQNKYQDNLTKNEIFFLTLNI